MSLISVTNLYKNFGDKVLFKSVTFNISEKDKIGIIGINGAGKSTLIKILLGLEEGDVNPNTHAEGTIVKQGNLSTGYLSQHNDLNHNNSAFEELMEVCDLKDEYNTLMTCTDDALIAEAVAGFDLKNGYEIQAKIEDILTGLELPQSFWYNKIGSLSGGQQTRVSLAKMLLKEPALLILDEPTNHLDLNAIIYLEQYLQNYKYAFVLISHDTYFLDNTVKTIFELEASNFKTYKGDYTTYVIQKEIYLSGALKQYTKEQDRIEKLEAFVLKYKAGQKAKQARGRQKLLDNMEKMENPVIPVRKMRLKFDAGNPSGSPVLQLNNLSKTFDNQYLFKNLTMEVLRGDRIGLIGKNGVGKSTILKAIVKQIEVEGHIEYGTKLNIGYYDQNHSNLNLKNNILDEIKECSSLNDEESRKVAGGFLFTQDDTFKIVGSLSGGERARVSLIKLLLSKPNFLIMDEPTNHLDIYSKEILTDALQGYKGTLLVVSHDRAFLNDTVTTIYVVDQNGLQKFDGNYDDYINSNSSSLLTQNIMEKNKNESVSKEKKVNISSLSYEEQKKIKNKINSLNKQISALQKTLDLIKKDDEKLYSLVSSISNKDNLVKIQAEIDKNHFKTIDSNNEIASLQAQIEKLEKDLYL